MSVWNIRMYRRTSKDRIYLYLYIYITVKIKFGSFMAQYYVILERTKRILEEKLVN